MADKHTTEKLLEGDRLSGKVTLFAKVTILPGDELSYHEHHGETEVYHILSGEGLYQDNDKTYPVEAEMTTFCEDGNGHAISCKGDAGISGDDSEKRSMIKNSVRGKETVERDFEREAFSAVFLFPCIRREQMSGRFCRFACRKKQYMV